MEKDKDSSKFPVIKYQNIYAYNKKINKHNCKLMSDNIKNKLHMYKHRIVRIRYRA